MVAKITGMLKTFWYRFCWRGRFVSQGPIRMERAARINLKQGKVEIGKGFSMKPNSYLAIVQGGELTIGSRVSLNRNAIIVCHDQIRIGDGCAIAPNVAIYDHDHRFGEQGIEKGFKTAPVIIEQNCWIGAGVIILRGTHIGEGCVIGAGCIVKGDIPAHSLVTSDRALRITKIEGRNRGESDGAAG